MLSKPLFPDVQETPLLKQMQAAGVEAEPETERVIPGGISEKLFTIYPPFYFPFAWFPDLDLSSAPT